MARVAKAPRRGRPPVGADALRGAIFSVRLSHDERTAIEEAAARAGRKASDWARDVLLAAAADAL